MCFQHFNVIIPFVKWCGSSTVYIKSSKACHVPRIEATMRNNNVWGLQIYIQIQDALLLDSML
jgi:hypothetical protein